MTCCGSSDRNDLKGSAVSRFDHSGHGASSGETALRPAERL
jgi:hypothetical protein